MSSFTHFDPALKDFFAGLKANNSKAWVDAHRADYDGLLMAPAKAFVAAMAPGLAKISPQIQADARVNGSIMRMNRDTRFSKDKTPYKTAIHFIFWEGGAKPKDGAGLYLKFDDREIGCATGLMGMAPKSLEKYRKAVLDDKAGKALEKAIKAVSQKPYSLRDPELKRIPKGLGAGHPRADLLRHQSLVVGGEQKLPKDLYGGDAVAFCLGEFKKLRPLHKWVVDNVL